MVEPCYIHSFLGQGQPATARACLVTKKQNMFRTCSEPSEYTPYQRNIAKCNVFTFTAIFISWARMFPFGINGLSKYSFEMTVGNVGARVVLPHIQVFSKKEVITCIAVTDCATCGNLERIQVARLNKWAGFGRPKSGHLW